jgi:hypothetical protein
MGTSWIDLGTSCRAKSGKPGFDLAQAIVFASLGSLTPAKAKFDKDHVYSMAPEAARKRTIDLQIIGDDYARSAEIAIDSEAYLKSLISIASGGSRSVSGGAKELQFFIIRGGGEGLLPAAGSTYPPDFSAIDASDYLYQHGSSSHKTKPFLYQYRYDYNDLLAVFDRAGKRINSALLVRPTAILDETLNPTDPKNVFRASTAKNIYDQWDNKPVFIYKNSGNFEVPFLGLHVQEKPGAADVIDMHKEEDSSGCILIKDPNTPEKGTDAMNSFEPQLILDVIAAVGKTPNQISGKLRVGLMQVIDIV